ncbi:single-stranded DNA-binding protein [Mucilaginibacter jinjuensis]|uniref:Single-stranded DNA-binding protein n=1 Tax=Mucilaginibacter jinjuensis TaxID=1176721 RepID=A0ABY7TIA8_9SPHI|nr:single-stranded DNA-binding protein [Mucilaginibacter jinjuensis]WCT14887.1 single-stranded DNA-binding protein [Mucilaginibacter jinjuensis]
MNTSCINKVMLVGHLGKDPELRYIECNVAVVSFPLATTEYWAKNGVKTEHIEWHNIVMWRGTAESAAEVLKKGELVYLEGKIKTHHFEEKTGIKKYITEVVADKFILLGKSSNVERVMPVKADYEINYKHG